MRLTFCLLLTFIHKSANLGEILNEAMISQWLKDPRAEYNSATETVKACLRSFRLHRRHKNLVWETYLMAMSNEPLGTVHQKPNGEAESGAVLGIDVGWSPKKSTTGLCLIEWTNRETNLFCSEVGVDDRQEKLSQLIQGRRLLAVGIDGPLIPKLKTTKQYRSAEALLSRGKFRYRGKPGPTNGGSGPELHKQATILAKLTLRTQDVGLAAYHFKIHEKAVVEAFPNAFLAVLHPDDGFPLRPEVPRRWTDTLFPRLHQKIEELLVFLLPQHKTSFNLRDIHSHEGIASFICALTALCVTFGRCIAVGDRELGYVVLPPLEYWGKCTRGSHLWASDTLRNNLASVRSRFNDVALYRDNKPWVP